MKIHPSARKALAQRLADLLGSSILEGTALNWVSLWKMELRGLSDTLDRGYREAAEKDGVPTIEAFVIYELQARAPLLRFVYPNLDTPLENLSIEELESVTKMFETRRVPLTSPIPDIPLFIEDLLRKYESLPWDYEYLVPLPLSASFANAIGESYALSDNIRLELLTEGERDSLDVHTAFEWQSEYKVIQALREIHGSSSHDFGPFAERFMLREKVKGYALVELSFPLRNPRSSVKQFLGLAMALKILEMKKGQGIVLGYGVPWWVAQTDSSRDRTSIDFEFAEVDNEWLPADEAACIGALSVSDDSEGTLRKGIHLIGSAFRREEARLLNAGRWYFESFCGTNQLLQFVQATTTLEIILSARKSDSKEAGLVKLLANSCAYFLGVNSAERERIATQVEQLYDARSRIVHTGKNVLDDESDLLAMRELARRVIEKELRFLASA